MCLLSNLACLDKASILALAEFRRTRAFTRAVNRHIAAIGIVGPPYQVVCHGRVRGVFFGWHYLEDRSPEYPLDQLLDNVRGSHYYESVDTLAAAEHSLLHLGTVRSLGLHTPERNRGSRHRFYAVAIGRASAIVCTHQECRALRRGTRSRVHGFAEIYEALSWIEAVWLEEGRDLHDIGRVSFANGYARQRSIDHY